MSHIIRTLLESIAAGKHCMQKTCLCVDTTDLAHCGLTYRNDCGSSKKLELCCEYCVYVQFFVQLVMGVNRILCVIIINQTIVTEFFLDICMPEHLVFDCTFVKFSSSQTYKHKHTFTPTYSQTNTHTTDASTLIW
jgi:hypothetical protein